MVDFVITLVGMGTLNISFAFDIVKLRGNVSSFVSIGLRRALGPCCAFDVAANIVAALLFELTAAIFDICCFCRYASVLKSVLDMGNGGVFDDDAFALLDAGGGLLVPSALYKLFKYEE